VRDEYLREVARNIEEVARRSRSISSQQPPSAPSQARSSSSSPPSPQ